MEAAAFLPPSVSAFLPTTPSLLIVKLKEERLMKERMRSLLGKTAAVLVLVVVLMVCVSSSSHSLCHGRDRTTRKLLSGAILAQQQQDMRVDGPVKPLKQAVVNFRRIPPSSSNPTQNKSRPGVDGPGNR